MRVLFLGTPRAAVPSLRALASGAHDVAAVVCQPDRPAGRGRGVTAPAVKVAAQELGLPVLQPDGVGTAELRAQVAALAVEVFVVVAYGRILGPKLLALAPRGALNVHFSLLPRWRGAAPVQRAILAGDEVTGVTTMQLVRELDAGPVLLAESTPIGEAEQAGELEARLAERGAALLLRTLAGLSAGTLVAREQDVAGVTLAPPLVKSEGDLDPAAPAEELARRVRALDPWPGARLTLASGLPLSLLEARVLAGAIHAEAPGTWLAPEGEGLPLACGGGSVLLVARAKPAGRSAMSGRSLVNGRVVRPGQQACRPARVPELLPGGAPPAVARHGDPA